MSPASPHTADTIAGYTLIERIGAGGYGEVWKAEAPGGLAKAVKLVYGYFDDQRAACERRALSRIRDARHPFLLSLERIEIVDGQLVVVTELADMSLKERYERCREEGKPGIPREELLVYVADAADALDYMRESHGLQHLDVKPENLLITSGRVKVADFGLVKSLQDEHVSLLGGLTPQYAPPELFDGTPSPASDQYSLAVVYQEMLTGTPPFPGRTAAQLANQHLHSQPQLNPLPPGDRPVVARALAKKPSDRFPRCRVMVDALAAASTGRPAVPLADRDGEADPQASSDTNPLRDRQTHTACVPPRPAAPHPTAPRPAAGQEPATRTLVLSEPATESDEPPPGAVKLPELPPAAEPVRLPPLEVSSAEDQALLPSLVLGVAGSGADVLRDLRKRIVRDERSFTQGNLEFLLLDTDSATIDAACGDRCEDSLEFRETLHVPLRTSAEYREQSMAHLQWLSRRWLFNIPRSLKTEGRRPLGRLALADHVQAVKKRIGEALAATADRIKIDPKPPQADRKPLRVVIVGSIGGGTAGGMLVDLGYLVRQVVRELGLPPVEIYGVLTHATAPQPDQQELAVANGYACLSEMDHYAVAGYPGDTSCGLAPSDKLAFDHTYLVHLGDRLDRRSYAGAITKVAEYLYLNLASPAGAFFDAARQATPPADTAGSRHVLLRTFGLVQFDPHHNEITSLAVEELSRSVVSQWLGGERFFEERSVEAFLESEFPELKELAERRKGKRKSRRSGPGARTEHKSGLEYLLDPESLRDVLVAAIEQQLGGKGVRVFQRWIKEAPARHAGEKRAFLRELDRSLGPHRRPGDDASLSLSELEQSLASTSAELAVMAVESIRDVLVKLTSNSRARIAGAQQAAQWLCDRLRQFERATSAEWT
ncbi:MAG: tubulin-like doman-containing protein, partial [Thermoguttaceae bacterium]